jgi:glycosyltransferase involved in cell wall biosynthesis
MSDLVDTFIFTSRILGERTEGYIPSSKRRVVPYTIDEKVRCTDAEVEAKIEERLGKSSLQVLYLSNMIETKGYYDLAEAIEQFNADSENSATVHFVGDWLSSEARNRFTQKLSEYAHADKMHVHGRIEDRSRVRQMMLKSDVFVLPTYYPNEAQPISIIEALNAGTPIISTRHASIPEYVKNNKNGYLVDKQSPLQIKKSIQLLSKNQNWKEKARNAREMYKEQFSPCAVKKKLLTSMFTKDD